MSTTSSFATGYNLAEAQLTMTLSTLAYIDENPLPTDTTPAIQAARMRTDINAALQNSAYSDWQVAWGPGLNDDRSNMLYVANNATTNQYAVVIRGTAWTFVLDWIEDLTAVLALVPFAPANNIDVQIAWGTYWGLTQLTSVTGVDPSNQQTDVLTFLKQAASQSDIYVTGHSLGGCLASVLAPTLASSTGLGSVDNLKVYTFAAPSAGNDSFATYYNNLFTDNAGISTAYRVYDDLDVVPNAWASLPTIETYYPPFVNCPSDIQSTINWAQSQISGKNYTQVGTDAQQSVIKLAGQILFGPATAGAVLSPIDDILFGLEALWQHGGANYLNLLSATQLSATTAKLRSFALLQSVA
jgi:hypothetical protein